MFYKKIIRPFFFKLDPEKIHKLVIFNLGWVSRIKILNVLLSKFFIVKNNNLQIKLGNLKLNNPIGLSAGFDKYIDAPLSYSMLGFGWAELGSITYQAQPGNPKPRLWRIPKDKGLIVYYGLSNDGAIKTAEKLKKIKDHPIPLGISIAPTTGLILKEMSDDYIKSFLVLYPYVDYITLNVSCPNVASCQIFAQVSFITDLLNKINKVKKEHNIKKDVFIKIGPEFNHEELDEIIQVCLDNEITGIIISNLIKKRENIKFTSNQEELNHPGGISGKLLQEKTNEIIKYVRQKVGDKLVIIGVGGIFTAQDAYDKLKAGADAVQLITGFIYGGPLAIKKINKGLIKILKNKNLK